MTLAREMIAAYPGTGVSKDVADARAITIDDLLTCAQTCVACADALLAEEDLAPLRRCIRLCLDCSDICDTTWRILSRMTQTAPGILTSVLKTCVTACETCGVECRMHAAMGMEHCRVCDEACAACAAACRELQTKL
jgi:hypothetical protein